MIHRCLSAAVLVLVCAMPVVAGHGTAMLDARRSTAGIHVELSELPPSETGTVQYRLRATGAPRDVTLDVWAKDFRQPFSLIASGFRTDGSGDLVSTDPNSRRPQRLDTLAFGPGPYPRGAPWEVALASPDRTIQAFARVIPRPIAARDGRCSVALELISDRGERFLASGSGFVPDDSVDIESRSSGRVSRKQRRASAEGLLPTDVISHASPGPDRRARYWAKGRYCEVTLDYEWGEAALQRR